MRPARSLTTARTTASCSLLPIWREADWLSSFKRCKESEKRSCGLVPTPKTQAAVPLSKRLNPADRRAGTLQPSAGSVLHRQVVRCVVKAQRIVGMEGQICCRHDESLERAQHSKLNELRLSHLTYRLLPCLAPVNVS